MIEMKNEEEQNECTQQRHATRIPLTASTGTFLCVGYRTRFAILEIEQQTVDNMQNQTEKKNNLHGADDRVGAHKVGALVESYAAIVSKDERVQRTVNNEEGDEKDAR